MKVLTCAAARRRLQRSTTRSCRFADQIAVGAHLDWCDACAAMFADLRLLRAALRPRTPGARLSRRTRTSSLQATVVSRAKAERTLSFAAQLRQMFDDMHLVYAGVGAAAAAVVCVSIMMAMLRFVTSERPDSLAAIVRILAAPGSNLNPVRIDTAMRLPRALDDNFGAPLPIGRSRHGRDAVGAS